MSSLDGLRALAVFVVFAHHVANGGVPGGLVGVTVFFVLSGYLITTVLVREYETRAAVSLRRFYRRRWYRLSPALVLMLAVCVPIAAVMHLGKPVQQGFAALTYSMDAYLPITTDGGVFTHTWSLAVEEQFYLLYPLVLLVALRRGWRLPRALLLGSAYLVALTAVLSRTSDRWAEALYPLPTTHAFSLACGIWLAFRLREASAPLEHLLANSWTGRIAAAALVADVVTIRHFTTMSYAVGIPLASVAGAALLGHLVMVAGPNESALSRRLGNPVLVWFGERSYAFYLWHAPILYFLYAKANLTLFPLIAYTAELTTLAVWLSWRFVEQPLQRYARRPRRERQSVTSSPAGVPKPRATAGR